MANKVLIIEDERLMLKVIEFRLKKDGFDVRIAEDGKEGLNQISTWQPDIIVTDIMMPFISGLEIISTVRQQYKLDIPIIILSAVGLEKTVIEAFGLGADDFITKPFSAEELSIRVRKNLNRR